MIKKFDVPVNKMWVDTDGMTPEQLEWYLEGIEITYGRSVRDYLNLVLSRVNQMTRTLIDDIRPSELDESHEYQIRLKPNGTEVTTITIFAAGKKCGMLWKVGQETQYTIGRVSYVTRWMKWKK